MMIVISKSVFWGNLDGARLLGHPVYKARFCLYVCTYASTPSSLLDVRNRTWHGRLPPRGECH